jgi:hypothetical protein
MISFCACSRWNKANYPAEGCLGQKLLSIGTVQKEAAVLWIRIGFNADLDPGTL